MRANLRETVSALTFALCLMLAGCVSNYSAPTPPAAPTNLSATAGAGQVSLTWAASTGATSYNVKRSTTSGGPYTQIGTTQTASFTDSGLTGNTTYYYVVSAVSAAGEGANSTQASATPTPVITVPPAPTGLSATVGNEQVDLTWNASTGATSYNIKRASANGGPYTQIGTSTTTSFSDTGLTNGTTYYYVVSAVSSAGESANSNPIPAIPNIVPATPAGFMAMAGNEQVSLTWSASPGATSYNVQRSTTSGGPYVLIASPTTTSFIDTGLTNGTTYYYVVSAVNSAGPSADSIEAPATPMASNSVPAPPTGLTATSANQQVNLAWTGSMGATSYNIKRSTTSGGPYTQVANTTTTSFSDTGLTNGTTYYYVVSAVSSGGESANSTEASATPDASASIPASPSGLTAIAGDQQVSLAWNASAGATGYNVKRATTSVGPFTQIASTTTASLTDTGLTNGTTYFYEVSAVNSAGESGNSAPVSATPALTAPNVTVVVTPSQTQPISPWIYGINGSSASIPHVPAVTIFRLGGNRWTAYNWTTNASNAGSDYRYESDDSLTSSTVPGFAVYPEINADIAAGQATLFTVPMQGLVSADESGPVSVANPPVLSRFQTIVDQKSTVSSAPFTTTPPITVVNGEDTGDVYSDEFVWAMNQLSTTKSLFSGTTSTPAFVDLDNEPELWSSTHLEVQGPNPITPSDYIAKTLTMTEALKTQFPNMIVFGPVHYGFLGIYNWQGAITDTTPTGANWFTDMYLQALSSDSATYGKPLVDVYDFHWYPEDYDANGTRVTSMTSATLSDADMQLIVQAPRNLWDPAFTDPGNSNAWINSVLGNAPIDILGRLQSKIGSEFPSMKLSISEYETGGFNNIAGTVAQADELGVFAQQGLFAAMFWPPSGTYDYELAGFRAFRNYDGAGANFGNVSVQTTSSNPGSVMVYASTDTATAGRVVMVAINRANTSQVVAINGMPLSGTATMYQMTASTAAAQSPSAPVTPLPIGSQTVSGSSLTLTLPAYSVTTIDIQ